MTSRDAAQSGLIMKGTHMCLEQIRRGKMTLKKIQKLLPYSYPEFIILNARKRISLVKTAQNVIFLSAQKLNSRKQSQILYTACGGSETPCNIARYYVMIVHCMVSVLSLVYKIAFFGIQLTNTVSVFRLESSPVVTSFANFHIGDP